MPSLQSVIEQGQDQELKFIEEYVCKADSEMATWLRTKSRRTVLAEERVAWLQSQLIGNELEFETPFGKRRLTYADHTASGRCLRYVENYIIQEVLPIYGNSHTEDSFVGSKTTEMVTQAADYIKNCMGARLDDVLLFCGSGTTAAIKHLQEVMGITVASIHRERLIQSLTNEERWVVFVGPYEHHSNLLSWRQSTAEVIEIGLNKEGLIDLETLNHELGNPKYINRPKLGSFSACSNVTGLLTDTRTVTRLLHRHGAFACFDFASCAPYVRIDMKSGDIEGYDAVFLSPHKFVGGPGTPGIILMNKALYRLGSSPPSTCAGGTVAYVNGFNEKDTIYFDDIEKREDGGTPPIIQKIRAALAFWLKEYIGHKFIDLQENIYSEMAMKKLLLIPNLVVLGNTRAKRLPIFSFLIIPKDDDETSDGRSGNGYVAIEGKGRPLHGRFVAKLLNDIFGIQARGGCACAGPYGHLLLGAGEMLSLQIRSLIQEGYSGLELGWTRVSFPYYMSKEEFEFILDSIEFVATYGHRFLPLYQFDWATGTWSFRTRDFKYLIMKEDLALSSPPKSNSQTEKRVSSNGKNIGKSHEKKSKITANSAQRFESYFESATRVALSLAENPQPSNVPHGIDPSMVYYRI